MPVIVEPEFDSFETMEAVADMDQFGAATARVSYYVRDDETLLSKLKAGLTSCPLVSLGILESARFTGGSANTIEGGIWKLDVSWKGVAAGAFDDDKVTIPNYLPSASTVPIETHARFEEMAGTPDAPLEGAIFDSQDNFERFAVFLDDGITPNPRAGIKSYYQATLKVTEKKMVKTSELNDIGFTNIGKRVTPDIEDLLELPLPVPGMPTTVRDHLFTSIKLEDLGTGCAMLDREWDVSGPFGWDRDIYQEGDA